MTGLSTQELDALFSSLKEKKFAVIGDFALDAYYFLDQTASENSIETGLRTNAVRSMRFTPGGAGNVAANLTSMGARRVYGLGVVGDDMFGREYLSILTDLGIDTRLMVVQQGGWNTCVYTKRYDAGVEKPRIDIGNFNELSLSSVSLLIERLGRLIPDMDVVLINQQLINGIHTPVFRAELKKLILESEGKVFLLDSRDLNDEYQGAIRKINDHEALAAAGLKPATGEHVPAESVHRAANILNQRWGDPVFITRGARGGLVHDGVETNEVPGLHILGKKDTVGAGDSIFAGLAAGLAAGLQNRRALLFASFVAGVTIGKLYQTGTASEAEIRVLAQSPEFNLNPEKAESTRGAEYLPDSDIEIITPFEKSRIEYALFDHDGTISTMREGWETAMEPVMVRAILGDSLDAVGQDVYARVVEDVRECIDATTGIQTLAQMHELVKMIEHWGFTPSEKILTPLEYKHIYLAELDRLISVRIRKVEREEMDARDFTVKGAVRFLKALRERGVTLYLVSGTDETDVRREAGVLGYADLFDGGIFGATDSMDHEPKRQVMKMILDRIGRGKEERVVTFGDGPVEMRESWKAGGVRIGIASDEVRRYGLNPRKRSRLILAGAQAVVPDFSQADRLMELLFHG